MKRLFCGLSLLVLSLTPLCAGEKGATKLMQNAGQRSASVERTFSSFDQPGRVKDDVLAAGAIKLQSADLNQVLDIYQSLSRRAVIRSSTLPNAKITLRSELPLTRSEALQAMDTVLAENGIVMILMGTRFVKAVPVAQAPTEPAPVIELAANQLPESNSYMIYVVPLPGRKPSQVMPALQPFARMPNSIVAIDSSSLLILRDYSGNVRQMLQVLERMGPAP